MKAFFTPQIVWLDDTHAEGIWYTYSCSVTSAPLISRIKIDEDYCKYADIINRELDLCPSNE